MKKDLTHIYILFVCAILAATLVFAWGVNITHADVSPLAAQVNIAANGQVIVRNAKVTSVSGTTIYASSAWGGLRIVWIIHTGGSTRFIPEADSAEAIKAIKPGELIGFSGALDQSASTPTVTASVVRNSAIIKSGMIISGTVLSLDNGAKTVRVATDTGTTTVSVGTGTIITMDGDTARLKDIDVGTPVRALGSLNIATNTLSAEKIALQSQPTKQAGTAQNSILLYVLRMIHRSDQLSVGR